MSGKKMKKKAPEEKPLLFLKNDVIFKKVFGDEKNKAVLKAFLIAVLDLPPEEYDEITISDPQLRVDSPDEKLGILDVYIKTREGKQIDTSANGSRINFGARYSASAGHLEGFVKDTWVYVMGFLR